jgi:hypothetical protein
MLYIYVHICKARNFNVVYIYIYGPTFGNAESRLFLFAAKYFNTEINAESYPVAHLCVNTLPATKVTLITDGI